MIRFCDWITEAKKRGKREPEPPTVVSSPLRGANQDQSGYGVSHDTSDYTISDEKRSNR